MRRFYRVSIALIAMLTIAALVWPATQAPVHYQPASTQAADIYSDYAPTGMTAVARRSRATSVYINVVKNNGFSGMASGTYGTYGGYTVVVTAAHVVDDAAAIIISSYTGEMETAKVAYLDIEADIAFLYVEPMESMPQRRFVFLNAKRDMIGKSVVYSGNPNRIGLLTIYGNVAGYNYNRIIIHSYAWMGASGSGVFDSRGHLIGVVSAINIGQWMIPQLIEDVVYVAPIYYINEGALLGTLEVLHDAI